MDKQWLTEVVITEFYMAAGDSVFCVSDIQGSMCLPFILLHSYRAIPILPDLKEVMDWMFTETSLKLFHWLKVQEIWAQLYIIKNLRKREKVSKVIKFCTTDGIWCTQNNPRVLGQPEGFVIKLILGGGLLALLILLIWGPLLVIALVNQTNVSNPPVEVSIQLSLGSFEVTKSFYCELFTDVL